MEKQIAYCGLICTDCAAYIATQNDDDEKRQEVVDDWTVRHNHPFKIEDINCDGCLITKGNLVGYCLVCPIRKCGQEKGVANCAYCSDYICDGLNEFFDAGDSCKVTLDKIKAGL